MGWPELLILQGAGILLAGTFVLYRAWAILADARRRLATSILAIGVIVDNLRGDVEGRPTFTSLVRFTTGTRREVVFESGVAGRPLYEVGAEVVVLYNNDRPEDAQVRDDAEAIAAPIRRRGLLIFMVGAGLLLIGSVLRFG